ncbi:monoacylglycerol lipase abhd6-B, partial [Biomphalaria glabrata]
MSTWVLLAAVIIGFNTVSLAAILCVYLLYPHYIILFIFWVQGYIAGLKTKYVSDGQVTFCYGEKNKPRSDKPSLVFIHGFTANKESWSQSIKLLPKDLHIIAVDLLGHGHSSVPGEEVELSMDYMMDTFHRFLELAGLSSVKVHLIGISLGGNIAGHYAVRHPETVAKVTMICPA